MSTGLWIVLDHLVALLGTATWFATGVLLTLRRPRAALAALVAAVLATLVRLITVTILASEGWWFVQEKVLLGLPLLATTGTVAALLTVPSLLKATRRRAAAGAKTDTSALDDATPAHGTTATPPSADSAPIADGAGPVGAVVSVFAAAYAALAGLGVTLLVGYPLTLSVGLIVVSLVCLGVLLTARVVAPRAGVARAPEGQRAISRRRFLGWTGGAVVVSAAGAGTGLSFLPAESVTTGGGAGHSSRAALSVADLRGPASPAQGGVVRRHVLTARKATVRLPSGREIDAWTYNGQVPGPAITASQGDLIEVRLRNGDIEDGVTLHWHGYDVPCGEDGAPGVTQPTVEPGAEFVYRFRADQAGTYWYHTHHASHVGVHKGLYGTLVVTPRDEGPGRSLELTLPVHTFDGTVVIAGSDGRADRPAAPGTPIRLRLINTDSNPHRIVLAGTPFRVAAVDGRDLNRPGEVADVGLRLPAGGRYDLVFRMPNGPVSLLVDNDRDGGLHLRPQGGNAPGEASAEDTSGLPDLDLLRYGAPAAVPFDARHADRHFTMVLDRGVAMVDGRPAFAQTVNGRGHPSIPGQLVTRGDIVRFTVVNRSLETHPWHLHGHPVLVLSRDGTPSTGSPLWVDTFDVRPGEKWEVAFRATNPGIWMNHCHNLPHAHQGMMLQLHYDGVTTPFGGSPGHGSHAH